MQSIAKQSKAMQSKAKQCQAMQSKGKAQQSKAKQCKAMNAFKNALNILLKKKRNHIIGVAPGSFFSFLPRIQAEGRSGTGRQPRAGGRDRVVAVPWNISLSQLCKMLTLLGVILTGFNGARYFPKL